MKKALALFAAVMMCGMLWANHWTPESASYSDVMTMNTVIQINGVEQTSDQLEVGVFCGEECRGSAMAAEFLLTHRYLAIITIYGQNGHQLTFKLYDHSIGQELNLTSPAAVTFNEDGYGNPIEPYVLNFTGDIAQNYNLSITGYGSSATGNYKLIASPIGEVNPTAVTNMLSNNYDLYYFDQTHALEWVNYKSGAFNLQPGKGYLYANSESVTLTFSGTPNSGSGTVTLVKSTGADHEGWNLVGNPFSTSATVAVDFYRMNAAGNKIVVSDNSTVNAMEGIFVKADTDGATMTFTPSAKGASSYENQMVLNVSQGNSDAVMDRAIVRFGDGNTISKLRLLDGGAEIYIPKNGTDYAIATSDGSSEMPIHFKVMQNDTYTLRVDFQGWEPSNLHLIDNVTGANIDLLNTPSYTFVGNTTDNASRFRLVFNIDGIEDGLSTNSEPFAYFNGSEWVIDGPSTGSGACVLQVIDVMGRMLRSESVSGNATMHLPELGAGVYVLRLVNGESVRTQKIVID